ncbi:MAG: (Fe-S)-binding protein [Rhizobiales bacterium]|nr:(Fe-S)-binding protein [Hyphomicrobiales bacterium]
MGEEGKGGAVGRHGSAPRVGLFVTCLVDAIRPSIGFASLKLLEDAGCIVEVPARQTCCGQPGFNSGDNAIARDLVVGWIEAFEGYDYVVVPSGSCAGMLKCHGGDLFAGEPDWAARHSALADRTYEIMSFLVRVMDYRPSGVAWPGRATYHDSCSGLRELAIHDEPRALLAAVDGLELVPLEGNDVCCGFGGTFCVKYPSISNAIVAEKARQVGASGAGLLLGGDLGCLMNMAGKLSREASPVEVRHAVEVLAGMDDEPALCRSE